MISALTDYKTPVMCDQAMTDASELSHYILPGGCTASGLDGKFLVDSHITPPRLSLLQCYGRAREIYNN